jgi:glycosyltransferase involved in cell wall biosynthesis
LFTHANYRDQLCTRHRERSFVTPAVWIDQADVLGTRAAEESWERKAREPVRLLLAGRLVLAKGVAVLLEALRELDARGIAAHVDTSGSGEEADACREAASGFRHVRLTNLDPVPYGKAIFERIRSYHAVLVPSLTQEQPRIVFDAYAQAVPVIASDTDGLRPYVANGTTGWLLPPGDAPALAAAIEKANREVPELRKMGLAALQAGRGFTHDAMHRWRSHLIREHCTGPVRGSTESRS